PEGVMGHVHHREVDRFRCAIGVVLARHVLPPGQVAIPMAWWIVPGWRRTWSIRCRASTRGTDVSPLRLRPAEQVPAWPASRSSPPKVSVEALTTHSGPEPEKPSARWICGSATLTMVASSTTISCAVAMTKGPGQAAGWSVPSPPKRRSSWLLLPEYAHLGQGAGVFAQVLGEQGGLFHGGEVAALVELRPAQDVREGAVGQLSDRQDDVVGVDRYGQWHGQRRQAWRCRGGRQGAGGLVVQLRGWPGGGGQPVDRRVGEQQVAVDRVLGEVAGAGPFLEFFKDPGQLPGWRVGQRVGECLRAGGLQLHVAGLILEEPGPPLQAGQVGPGELG